MLNGPSTPAVRDSALALPASAHPWAIQVLTARRPEIATTMAEAIFRDVAEYGSWPHVDVRTEILNSCNEHLLVFIQLLRTNRRPMPEDFAFVRALAVQRAREFLPLHAYLASYRVSQLAAWQFLLRLREKAGVAESLLLELSSEWLEYIDVATGVAAQSFVGEHRRLAHDAGRQGRDVLESLLSGRLSSREARAQTAAVGLLEAPRYLVTVIMQGIDAKSNQSAAMLSDVAAIVGRELLGVEGLQPLVIDRYAEVVALVPIKGVATSAVTAAVSKALVVLRQTKGWVLTAGVSLECLGMLELRDAYVEAQQAVELAALSHGLPVLGLQTVRLLDYVIATCDATAQRLIAPTIAKAMDQGSESGRMFTTTVLEYVQQDLNVPATAAALHVHQNTIYYRLSRLHKATGLDPRSFNDIVELLLAVRLLANGTAAT